MSRRKSYISVRVPKPPRASSGSSMPSILGSSTSREPRTLDELLAENEGTREKILGLGGAPPDKAKTNPSALDRIFGVLRAPAVFGQSILNNALTDRDVDPLKETVKALGGHDSMSFDKLLTNLGWDPDDSDTLGKAAKFVVSFAGEVVTDPLTWLTGGTTAAAKSTARVAAATTMKRGLTAAKVAEWADKGVDVSKVKEIFEATGKQVLKMEDLGDLAAQHQVWRGFLKDAFLTEGHRGGLRFVNRTTGKQYTLIENKLPTGVNEVFDKLVDGLMGANPLVKNADTLKNEGRLAYHVFSQDAVERARAARGGVASAVAWGKKLDKDLPKGTQDYVGIALEESRPQELIDDIASEQRIQRKLEGKISKLESQIAAKKKALGKKGYTKAADDAAALKSLQAAKQQSRARLIDLYSAPITEDAWGNFGAKLQELVPGIADADVAKARSVMEGYVGKMNEILRREKNSGSVIGDWGDYYVPHRPGNTSAEVMERTRGMQEARLQAKAQEAADRATVRLQRAEDAMARAKAREANGAISAEYKKAREAYRVAKREYDDAMKAVREAEKAAKAVKLESVKAAKAAEKESAAAAKSAAEAAKAGLSPEQLDFHTRMVKWLSKSKNIDVDEAALARYIGSLKLSDDVERQIIAKLAKAKSADEVAAILAKAKPAAVGAADDAAARLSDEAFEAEYGYSREFIAKHGLSEAYPLDSSLPDDALRAEIDRLNAKLSKKGAHSSSGDAFARKRIEDIEALLASRRSAAVADDVVSDLDYVADAEDLVARLKAAVPEKPVTPKKPDAVAPDLRPVEPVAPEPIALPEFDPVKGLESEFRGSSPGGAHPAAKASHQMKRKNATIVDRLSEGVATDTFLPGAAASRYAEGMVKVADNEFLDDMVKTFGQQVKRGQHVNGKTIIEIHGKHYAFPKAIARDIETVIKPLFDDKAINDFLKAWRKGTSIWRTTATVLNPGFTFRNIQSNFYLAWAAGYGGKPELWDRALKIANGKIEPGTQIRIGGKYGKSMPIEDYIELSRKHGVHNGGQLMDLDQLRPDAAVRGAKGNLYTKAAEVGGTANEIAENWARHAVFIQALEKTGDPRIAAGIVDSVLYSYDPQNLSKAAQGLRDVFPFATWTIRNLPAQVNRLIHDPSRLTVIDKMQRAGGDWMDKDILPDYMREMQPIPLPFKNEDGNNLMFNPNWGFQDLNALDPSEGGQQLISMLHPAIKLVIEGAMDTDSFRNEKLHQYTGQLVKAPDWMNLLIKPLGGEKWFQDFAEAAGLKATEKGLYMDPYASKALSSVPLLTNIGRALTPGPQQSSRAASWLAGLKTMPYEEEQFKTSAAWQDRQLLLDYLRMMREQEGM